MKAVRAEEERATAALSVRGDVPASELDRYVHGNPQATGYHLAAWRGVIERAFGHETMALAALCGDRIEGVLPLVFFDVPELRRSGRRRAVRPSRARRSRG